MLVRNDLSAAEVEIDGDTKDLEPLWVRVEVAEGALYVSPLYHPPIPIYEVRTSQARLETTVQDMLRSDPKTLCFSTLLFQYKDGYKDSSHSRRKATSRNKTIKLATFRKRSAQQHATLLRRLAEADFEALKQGDAEPQLGPLLNGGNWQTRRCASYTNDPDDLL